MKTIDKIFALLGIVVGALLLAYAYYANAHGGGVLPAMQNVYLWLFPPSFGLMATDNASPLEGLIAGVIVVAANGVLYGVICMAIRKLLNLCVS